MINSTQIEDFLGLTKLKELNLKSNDIKIIEQQSFDSFSYEMERLKIANLSNANLSTIKSSFLNPWVVRNFSTIVYSFYIENRVDLNCVNVLLFLRAKINYNLENCNDISKIRAYLPIQVANKANLLLKQK